MFHLHPYRLLRIDEYSIRYLKERTVIEKVNALRELQSATGEELSALLPSVLDKAFKGEL